MEVTIKTEQKFKVLVKDANYETYGLILTQAQIDALQWVNAYVYGDMEVIKLGDMEFEEI